MMPGTIKQQLMLLIVIHVHEVGMKSYKSSTLAQMIYSTGYRIGVLVTKGEMSLLLAVI
jgi:hypothetical protein